MENDENKLSQEAMDNGHRTTGQPLSDEARASVEDRKEARVAGDVADKADNTATETTDVTSDESSEEEASQ